MTNLDNVIWGDFKIGDLFDKVKTKKLKYKASELPSNRSTQYNIPCLTASTQNQGLSKYVPEKEATVIEKAISVSANGTPVAYYQDKPFTVLQDAYALKWKYTKNDLTSSQYLFCTTLIMKEIKAKYSWNNKSGWEKVKNDKITLPVLANGDPDYNFMEEFIKDLETEQFSELDIYLQSSGLSDTKLTKAEQKALDDFDSLTLGQFKIGDLFTIEKTQGFNKEELTSGLEYDYITRTSMNQGILQTTGLVDSRKINEANVWSLGLLQMDFFYRKKQWYAGQFVRKIKFTKTISQEVALYLTTVLNHITPSLLTVLVRDIDKKFKETIIQLPVDPTEQTKPDYQYMETYIKAIEKLTIKDVVDLTTKKVV